MKTFGLFAFIVFLLLGGYGIVQHVIFDVNATSFLKRAATATNLELAAENLAEALEEIEARGLTRGHTDIAWHTPQNDLGYWHQNLSAALEELRTLPAETTALERTNVLMKLRETLVSGGEDGASVVMPQYIGIYPFQIFWFWGMIITGLVSLIWFMAHRRL